MVSRSQNELKIQNHWSISSSLKNYIELSTVWDQSGICSSNRLEMRAIWKKNCLEKWSIFWISIINTWKFKLMLQTNYLTQTSEILIQKTSNIVLQKKNHFKSSGRLVCPWHRFFLLHLTLKTLYMLLLLINKFLHWIWLEVFCFFIGETRIIYHSWPGPILKEKGSIWRCKCLRAD